MTAGPDPESIELLQHAAPEISDDEAVDVLRQCFGITGTVLPLCGERDRNFHIRTTDGREYVLKIAHPLEKPQFIDFQTEALRRVAAEDPGLPVPRVITSRGGRTSVRIQLRRGERSTVRLVTYLPGIPLSERVSTPHLRTTLATCLARLDKALAEFVHPGATDRLLWNLTNAGGLRKFLPYLADARLRSLADSRFCSFERDVLPRLQRMRRQVVHNDLNPSNILVHPDQPERLTGVIDFGDLVDSFRVVDVAVAAAYQLRYSDDPFDAVKEFVAAYHRENPLDAGEIDLLFGLIGTRLALSTVITAWRAGLHPENREYILRNANVNAELLRRFEHISETEIQERLKAACGDADAGTAAHTP